MKGWEAYLKEDWILHQESIIGKQIYSVKSWIEYLDVIDDKIVEAKSKTTTTSKSSSQKTAAMVHSKKDVLLCEFQQHLVAWRDLVARRALALMPRSYKLWKNHWEFLITRHHHPNIQQQHDATTTTTTTPTGSMDFASSSISRIVACFERAVWTLSSYPRVWIEYIQFTWQHPTSVSCTEHRRIWNRAFQSVPVAQHDKLWHVLVERLLLVQSNTDVNNKNNNTTSISSSAIQMIQYLPWETAHRLLYRYTQYDFQRTREYAAFCEIHGRYGAAAQAYVDLLNQTTSSTMSTSSSSDWQSFCELVAQHSNEIEQTAGIDWEIILQTAIRQQQQQQQQTKENTSSTREEDDTKNGAAIESTSWMTLPGGATTTTGTNTNTKMLGLLYSWFASAWIQRGNFDMARSVYEEGILAVRTVRDFSILFAAYMQLEEGLLTAITDSMEDWEEEEEEENESTEPKNQETQNDEKDDWDLLLSSESGSTRNKLTEIEVAMARAEHLTARRPLLLNAVKLRQNPNQCPEWIQRAELYLADGQSRQAATVLEEALQTVQNRTPGISAVVVRLVRVYEQSMDDLTSARDLLDRVCRQRTTALGMTRTEELAECWAMWIELELKHENWDEALSLARQSVASQGGKSGAAARRKPMNLTKSLRLWDLLLDMEESLGTIQTTKDAYNRAMEIKVATVQHILNFGSFLAEHKYFEESLTAYERGIELFAFPHIGAKLLWKAYLDAFLKRYGGTKVERARNLFQRCTKECPSEECAEFFIMNGEFEEEFGLTKRALSVYKALCDKVPEDEKYNAYQLLIAKTTKYLGIAATRYIYQEAVEKLKDAKSFVKVCQDFAKMEMTLQEVDRARAIFAYGAQSADPRRIPEYWKDWNDFEIANGNEDTFREMLRVKRSVEAAFSTVNYNAAGMAENIGTLSTEEAMAMVASAEGVEIEEPKKSNVQGFVPSKRPAATANLEDMEERVAKLRKATGMSTVKDTTEINEYIDDDDDADDDNNEIDIDDIDAEIEAAAAEGFVSSVQDVSTQSVPDSVLGKLASQNVI